MRSSMKTAFIIAIASVISCQQAKTSPVPSSSDGNDRGVQSSKTEPATAPAYPSQTSVTPQGEVKIWLTATLPKCDSERDGSVLYVIADAAFKHCIQGDWNNIDLRGPKGDSGDPSARRKPRSLLDELYT